ncbi:S8 family peptidase [Thermaurantiacus tibetensis]|uniref:S8 family peptidase n=1 Tax=Thermaurantiacus tibetensis TaxID=2759035 RepID=UPI00188EF486|nr:S8 family serine peptidase [Thermaurantiacus tibetensis]
MSSATLPAVPGAIVLTLALGEAPEAIPARNDVRDRACAPAERIDGGAIDRIIRTRGGGARIARLHTAAAGIRRIGHRHRGYSDLEQLTGVARTFVVRTDRSVRLGELVDTLMEIPTVERAIPNYLSATPFDLAPSRARPVAEDTRPWDLVRADAALAREPGDDALILGVIDSGMPRAHPEFGRPLRQGYDTVRLTAGDVAAGVTLMGDLQSPDRDPVDEFVGHGAGCAGIVSADGVGMHRGLAGAARLLPMRALGAARLPDRSGWVGLGAIADLDAALKLAVDLGARVLNLSFGTDDALLPPALPKPHAETVAYAAARDVVMVAASGNNGREALFWPAAFPEVIAVGACDADGRPAPFSTRGSHVALAAPGVAIRTAALDGYQRATGTSFAAPFVAATAALMLAHAARRAAPLAPSQVRALLMAASRPFAAPAPGMGAGILDALSALEAVEAAVDPDGPDDG